MAKLYSRAEWSRIQSRLPDEDRIPYELSPDRPTGPSAIARGESGTIGAVSAARNMPVATPMDITSQRYTAAAQAAGITPTSVSETTVTPSFIDQLDVRNPVTGFTPAQIEAQKALQEAVATAETLGINTKTNVAEPGFIPTVTVTGTATTVTGPTPTTQTGPVPTTATAPAGVDPAITALLAQLQQQNLAASLAAQAEADRRAAEARAARQSAYDLLYQQFSQYGLQALVEPLKGFITSGINPSEFTIRLRETDAYKKRFAANQARINKGLRALSEAEYIGLEDQYQDVMRRYGLPDTYYTRGEMGRQEGFEKFIGGDVSPVELEDRIQTAQRRVINAAPEITESLRSFYPEIGQGDLLAYFLDPDKAIENIKRKVTAAEIGGAATMAGLATGVARAEELGRFGVTGEQARQGFQTIADILPSATKLSEIYSRQGVGPYNQTTAEQEVFGITGASEASRRRRQLTQLETAAFSGQAGTAGGALGRERAGAI